MSKSNHGNGQDDLPQGITPEAISEVVAENVILQARVITFIKSEEVSVAEVSCLALEATSEYVETMREVFGYEPTFEDINRVMDSVLKLSEK